MWEEYEISYREKFRHLPGIARGNIADKFIVHQELNQLPSSRSQLTASTTLKRIIGI